MTPSLALAEGLGHVQIIARIQMSSTTRNVVPWGHVPDRARGVTTRQRTDRNAEIFAARARGIGWARIAAEYGISERQAQRIYTEQRENRATLASIDPVEVVEELLVAYDAAVEDLAVLAQETGHDGTRLGAIRARIDATRAKHELLAAVGVLPHDLGRLSLEIDGRVLGDTLVRVLERHDLPQELWDDLERELSAAVPTLAQAA